MEDGWGIVEIMGHRRFAGRLSEETVAGAGFVRIDVPECEGRAAFTKLFGPSAIYAITPTDEASARAAAAAFRERPVEVYGLLPAPAPRPIPDDPEDLDGHGLADGDYDDGGPPF